MKIILNSIRTKVIKNIHISQNENNELKKTNSITILKNSYRILFAQRIVKNNAKRIYFHGNIVPLAK